MVREVIDRLLLREYTNIRTLLEGRCQVIRVVHVQETVDVPVLGNPEAAEEDHDGNVFTEARNTD